MDDKIFSLKFQSDIYKVKSIVNDLLSFFSVCLPKISDQDLYELKLVFSELLLNAVIHGNKEDKCKTVSLYVKVSLGSSVYAEITDEGSGFDYLKLISMSSHEESLLKEHGRGIKLVHSLTDNLSFNVTGNKIKFYKKVSTNG